MHNAKPWLIGFLILLLFVILGEMTVAFSEYFYQRTGFNRNYILMILWILPLIASLYAAYYAQNYKFILGMSYVVLLPILGVLAHYINGKLGGSVDLISGVGLIVVAQIYFFLSIILCGIGTFLGNKLSEL